MKKISILLIFVLLTITLILVISNNTNKKISNRIIKTIDNSYNNSKNCTISMKKITSFKWDRLVVFRVASSRQEVSEALGFEYKYSTDLMAGMIFVKGNKIVYREEFSYDPEKPNKLGVYLKNEKKIGVEPTCRVFNINNAVFKGIRDKIDNIYYYEMSPIN